MKRVALGAVLVLAAAAPLTAHKPVTSKYTYSEDVYPIVKEHCAGCHVPGGIAPMSLLTYEDARPWAESIRLELTSGHMPPWYGDPSVAPLREDHALSPRDLDVVLTWVTGGTPPGPPMKNATPGPRRNWSLGRPDLSIQLPEAVNLAADQREDTREFVLLGANERDRLVASADLLPGNAAIVHDATIFTRAPGSSAFAAVLATWIPGETLPAPAAGEGFAWRAGEQLVARIHYKKNWKLENKPASDRSTVGVYFAKTPSARALRSVGIRAGESMALDEAIHVVAVHAADTAADSRIEVEALRPDGSRVRVAGFGVRPGWNRRYWLARAIDLPKSSRIVTKGGSERLEPIQVWLDVLP